MVYVLYTDCTIYLYHIFTKLSSAHVTANSCKPIGANIMKFFIVMMYAVC